MASSPSPSMADLLEALSDCLDGADRADLVSALTTLERAGGGASLWAHALTLSVRGGSNATAALAQSGTLEAPELSLLRSVEGIEGALAPALRCIALRRRLRATRARASLAAVIAPLSLMALTLALDPLPALILGGAYFGPVLRALSVMVLAVLVMTALLLLAFVHPRTSPAVMGALSRVPFVGAVVRRHAESELSLVLGAFADEQRVPPHAWKAATSLLGWAPFSTAVRDADRALQADDRPADASDVLASVVSQTLSLVLVSGSAARRLPERLTAFGERAAEIVTRRVRALLRTLAFAALIALSVQSLAKLVKTSVGGIPGMPGLPGDMSPSAEQKELDQIMKEGH